MKIKAVILFAFVCAAQFSFAQKKDKQLDSLFTSLYKSGKFNGNVLIAEKGNIVFEKSYGLANEEKKQELQPDFIFELASCSKQFTAMGIMILKEQGKLQLDDKINKYIPELATYNNVSIRNLLHHTGGLPDYMELMDSLFDKSNIANNIDIIALFAKHQPKVLFPPNTKYQYSNTGYALLASVIENASGISYADFLQKNIFDPLKMENTFVYTRRYAPKSVEKYAFGYVYSDSLHENVLPDVLAETNMVVWLDGIVGDGCVNSNVEDLLKWDRALYTNKLLSAEGMKTLFEGETLLDKTVTKYGLGWMVTNSKDFGKIVNHTGGWPGYKTFIERHITNDKTIIILQNHEEVEIPVTAVRSILYNKPLPVKKERKEIKLPEAQLEKYAGVYEIEEGVTLTVTKEKEQLFVRLTGQNAFPIFPESELLFFLKVVDAQLQFAKDEAGKMISVTLLQNGQQINAKRKE